MSFTPTPEATFRVSIRDRISMQAVILTTFIIVVLATITFVISRKLFEQNVLSQLTSLTTFSENLISSELASARSRGSLLSSHAVITEVLRSGSADGPLDALFEELQEAQPSLRGIHIFDGEGALLAAIGQSVELPNITIETTMLLPRILKDGWQWYDVIVPLREANAIRGYLVLRHSPDKLLSELSVAATPFGEGGNVFLGVPQDDDILVIYPKRNGKPSRVVTIGKKKDAPVQQFPIGWAMRAIEGVGRAIDHEGQTVLAGYRYLPDLGWGVSVQVDRDVALQGVRSMARTYAFLGLLLTLLAGALSYFLSKQLTNPLKVLALQVRGLQPGHWSIERSVHTGDEVELLDGVVVDMATRLRKVYEHQEEEIAKRTEELKKQYALDRAVLEGIQHGVLTTDQEGKVTGTNPAALRLLGLAKEEILDKAVEEMFDVRGHQGAPLPGNHPAKECLERDEVIHSQPNGHWNVQRRDGTLLPVMFAVTPLLVNEKLFGTVIVFQDISEERKLDYLKSEFISLASHQLRTPLSTIRWYVELLGEEGNNWSSDEKSYIKEIDHALKRMVALLSSLLRAAHLEEENLKPEPQDVNIVELVEDMAEDSQPLFQEAHLTCTVDVPKEPLRMTTDPTLVRIALQNLLTNAAKYSRKGESVIMTLRPDTDTISISVKDQGVGIPKVEQDRLFQKFFRGTNVRKMDTDGNGLGLYMTKSIVERLGGTITFVSEEDKGTEFTITLPKEHKNNA